MFKVGDRVRIRDEGQRWGTPNKEFAAEHGLTGTLRVETVPTPTSNLCLFVGRSACAHVSRLELVPDERPCIPPPAPNKALLNADYAAEELRVLARPAPPEDTEAVRAPVHFVHAIPQDDPTRKAAPMYRGLLGYFPYALFQVAAHAMKADLKHNPDSPDAERPTWAKGKSSDHLDCIVRHLAEMHTDEAYHRAAIAWRALAQLQEYGESLGFAVGAHAVLPEEGK